MLNSAALLARLLLINRPRRDGRLSWPSWLTHSGRLTHKVVIRQPWIRRRSGKVRRLQTDILTTVHLLPPALALALSKCLMAPLKGLQTISLTCDVNVMLSVVAIVTIATVGFAICLVIVFVGIGCGRRRVDAMLIRIHAANMRETNKPNLRRKKNLSISNGRLVYSVTNSDPIT